MREAILCFLHSFVIFTLIAMIYMFGIALWNM